MSIVAWDGKTLAADRQMTNCGYKRECRKLWVESEFLALAITGGLSEGLAMVEWYRSGADLEKYPTSQTTDRWSRLIVVSNGKLWTYEQGATAIPWDESKMMAWGSGCDFAIGAMAAGATAEQAVEITTRYSVECGFGVDSFSLV